MKEEHKIIKYPSGNPKTETYKDDETFVTKHYYDAKDAYVKELIYLKDGIKKVKHISTNGVASKLEHFVEDKRQGQEIRYFVSKADGSVKSIKFYDDGKLHGENITYNTNGEIIKHEVYALGKLVLKYLRKDSDNNEITNVQILDKDNVVNLPKVEYEKLQTYLENNPKSFVETVV